MSQNCLCRDRQKQQIQNCTRQEQNKFLLLTSSLNFLWHGVFSQAAFITSHLQPAVENLTIWNLVSANKCLIKLKAISPKIAYLAPKRIANTSYPAFADATHGKSFYGLTGYSSGIIFPCQYVNPYHMIDWQSSKQEKAFFFINCGRDFCCCSLNEEGGACLGKHTLYSGNQNNTSSHAQCWFSWTMLDNNHSALRYRLSSSPTISPLWDSFNIREIATIQWIRRSRNLADAWTKRSIPMFDILNNPLWAGKIERTIIGYEKRAEFTIWSQNVYHNWSSTIFLRFLSCSLFRSSKSLAFSLFLCFRFSFLCGFFLFFTTSFLLFHHLS